MVFTGRILWTAAVEPVYDSTGSRGSKQTPVRSGLDIERVFVFRYWHTNGRSIRSTSTQSSLGLSLDLPTVTPHVETSLMAAILNPTALSAHADLVECILESGPASEPVAPWNRASVRSSAATSSELRAARHLRLVTDPAPATAVSRRRPVRVLLGGLGLAVLVAFAAMGVLPFLGADAAASTPASPTEATSPAVADAPAASAPVEASVASADSPSVASAPTEVIVQQGDSIWTVARRLQPRGDLRHLVDALIERAGGASVVRGQHIDVRGLLD